MPQEETIFSQETEDHGLGTNRDEFQSGQMNPAAKSDSLSKDNYKSAKVKFDPDADVDAPPSSEKGSRKKKSQEEEDHSNDLTKKKTYISRRTKNYDDSASDDENNDKESSVVDTGVITYQDTKGNVTSLKPNLRFLNYKHVFKDLIK